MYTSPIHASSAQHCLYHDPLPCPANTLPPIRLGPQLPTGPNPILAPETSPRWTKLASYHHHRFLSQPTAPCRAHHALLLARTTCTTHSTRTSFVAATFAPRSSSSVTTSMCPFAADKCSAVRPSCEEEHTSTLQPPRLPSTPCPPHSTIPSSAGTRAPCLLPCHTLPMLTPYASPLVAPLHPTPGPSPSLALSGPTTCLHQSTPASPLPLPCAVPVAPGYHCPATLCPPHQT